jgi:hypothetical protein
MSSNDSHDDDGAPDSGDAYSRDALTPRGGFMARPGLKVPPRHAVVVRVGDAPESDDIPLARPSVPPPPPSEPAPVSASEKVTLRAIPTPSVAPPAVESVPLPSDPPSSSAPLSDAPLIAASVRAPDSRVHSSRRRSGGSGWTIGVAAAAGLLLGLASIATRAKAPHSAARAEPVPQAEVEQLPLAAQAAVAAPAPSTAVLPSASAEPNGAPPENAARALQRMPAALRPESAGAKRSIF